MCFVDATYGFGYIDCGIGQNRPTHKHKEYNWAKNAKQKKCDKQILRGSQIG